MKRITDKAFVYTPACATDVGRHLRAHLEAERKFLRAWDEAIKEDAARAEKPSHVVTPIRKERAK